MNITERYVSAYMIECLMGYHGEFPEYVGLVKTARVRQPVMKEVVNIINGADPRNPDVVKKVREFLLRKITNAKTNV